MTDRKEKFTQGEWLAKVNEENCYVMSDGILLVDPAISDVDEHEQDANAHLIAAAPAMYRMLKNIADDNRGFDDGFVHEIDNLLAKARGEQGDNNE